VVIALLVGIALVGYRYVPVAHDVAAVRQSARQVANQASALEPANLDRASLDRLSASFEALEGDLAPLRELIDTDPIVDVARGLPGIGTQVEAADSLVLAADALLEAGNLGLGLAGDVVELREANDADPAFALMPGLVELVATSGDRVDRIDELISTAEAELARIPDDALPQVLEARDLVAEPLARYAPLLDTYREYDDVIPELLGWGEQKRYLVLAQNPAELRPTGGYAGTVGIITLEDGAIVEQRFRDVHELSRMPNLPFVKPPQDLADYLLGDDQSWRLADANWSPDFPTSAQQAVEFYELESGESGIDGVIAITTYALDRLLEVVGPVEVPQYDVTVEPGDVTLTLLGATRGAPTSVEGRKDVLDVLARRLMDELLSLPPERWEATMEAIEDIGARDLALAWLADEDAQQLVEDADWDGHVRQDAGDYVFVVESNVAPTSKYNLVVDRTDSLVVKLDEAGDALSSLRLDWQNAADQEGQPYRSLREFSTDEAGAYGSWVRVLVPEGSELVTASGVADVELRGPDRIDTESGRALFGNYLYMLPGASSLTYLWSNPGVAVKTDQGWVYELVVQNQPGARSVPLSVRVDLPTGAVVSEISDGAVFDGEQVRLEANLDQDVELRVVYELAR
jgi:hypothetical protein